MIQGILDHWGKKVCSWVGWKTHAFAVNSTVFSGTKTFPANLRDLFYVGKAASPLVSF